jgi:hypothetical protein
MSARREAEKKILELESAWVSPGSNSKSPDWQPLPGLRPFANDGWTNSEAVTSPDRKGPLSEECVSVLRKMWEGDTSGLEDGGQACGNRNHFHCYRISLRGAGARVWLPWQAKNSPSRPRSWWCSSLRDAAINYSWSNYSGGSFEHLSAALQAAMHSGNSLYVAVVCCKILDWGGVRHRPKAARLDWLIDAHIAGSLIPDVKMGVAALRSPSASPLAPIFGAHYPKMPMTSGTTKIFAAAAMSFLRGFSGVEQDVIIFDGRVGAALGLIARRLAHGGVPAHLRFPWGHQSSRNPSCAHQRFPSMASLSDMQRAEFARLAGESIQQVIGTYGPSSQFVEAEKALFMVGYDVRTDCGGSARAC